MLFACLCSCKVQIFSLYVKFSFQDTYEISNQSFYTLPVFFLILCLPCFTLALFQIFCKEKFYLNFVLRRWQFQVCGKNDIKLFNDSICAAQIRHTRMLCYKMANYPSQSSDAIILSDDVI